MTEHQKTKTLLLAALITLAAFAGCFAAFWAVGIV